MIKKILNTTSLKANIVANFVGNGWSALISILFVPVYLKYIGTEGYGLIGIFTSLQVVLSLLDNGLSTTLNKELARLSVLQGMQQRINNLVKTLGNIYWAVALTAGAIALCISPLLSKYWIHPKDLSVQTVTYVFIILSISIVFQFVSGFYSGGLLGLQRQVMLNFWRVIFATLRSAGVVLILIFVSRSIIAFFAWTLLISILQALVFQASLWYYLPKATEKPRFDKQELNNIWRFVAGMTAIGLTSVLLTQTDSIILSKILSLKGFGYYTLAFTVGSISYSIVGPVSQSYFPKLAGLLAENKIQELTKTYHQGCQMVTLVVLPFAIFLSLFSKEILLIWVHNPVTVENTWKITSIVSLAVAIHCLMFIPFMLCLTYNYTKLALYTNIAILTVLIPGTIFSAINYGGLGGAICWLIINLIYLILSPLLIHSFFLKGEAVNWYWHDTFKPVIGCVILFTASRWFLTNYHFNTILTFCMLVFIGVAGFCITLLSYKELKERIFKWTSLQIKGKSDKISITNEIQ